MIGPRVRALGLALLAVALVAAGVLLGALMDHRLGRHELGRHRDPIDWSRLTATDLRIAAAFGALQREGLAASLDVLERAAREDSVVLRDGHQLAHALGRLAVAESGGNAAVIRECRSTMASGCYHGVVEAFVQARGHVDMAELEQMCNGAGSDSTPGPVYACIHGLGHGVLGAVGNLEEALHDCDALAPPRESWCHAGVFMEGLRIQQAGHSHEGHGGHGSAPAQLLPTDPSDPYRPCDRFKDPYASACWIFQGFVILQARGFDPAQAFSVCDRAAKPWVVACYQSVGFQLTGVFQREDAWIVEQCARGRADLSAHCAAGAARALAEDDWTGGRPAAFCRAGPRSWKDACYQATGALLVILSSRAQRSSLCARVEADYVESCRQAAAL